MKIAAALVVSGCLFSAVPASAQVDFSGAWRLDRDISSDPAKATFDAPKAQAPRNTGMTGGFSGFGGRHTYGGGSGRPTPTRPSEGRNDGGGAPTQDELAKLRALTLYVKGLATIAIEHTDHATFTVTDGSNRAHLYPTDGTQTPQAFDTTTVDSVTKWDGPHMVTVYTIGPTRKLVFTYILVPLTKQMALRIQLEESGKTRTDVPELRLIYKLAPATHASPGFPH